MAIEGLVIVSMWRSRQPQFWQAVMSEHEMKRLAQYNGERSRGIAHQPEYVAHMVAGIPPRL